MENNMTIPYAAIQAAYTTVYAGCGAFISSHLLSMGYSSTDVGLILSTANLSAVVLQPIQASIASRNRGCSLYRIICLLTAFLAIACLPMLFIGQKSVVLSALYVVVIAGHSLLSPLINALSNRSLAHGISINYGVSRGMGSVGYACMTGLLGAMIPLAGVRAVPGASLACLLCLLIVLLATAKRWPGSDPDSGAKAALQEENWLRFLSGNKRFIAINMGGVLLLFGLYTTTTFLLQIVQPLGGTSAEMGRILSIGSILEVPALFAFDALRKRFRNNALLMVSMLGLIGKTLLTFAAPSVGVIYAAQVFQLIGFGMYYPAMIQYISENMSAQSAIRAQTLLSLAITMSSMVANFAGGMLIDLLGVSALGWISVSAGAIGAVFVIAALTADRRRKA